VDNIEYKKSRAYRGFLDIVENFIKERPENYPAHENWRRKIINFTALNEIIDDVYQDSGQNIKSRLALFSDKMKAYHKQGKLFIYANKPSNKDRSVLVSEIFRAFERVLGEG